jgi:hypothetical protein
MQCSAVSISDTHARARAGTLGKTPREPRRFEQVLRKSDRHRTLIHLVYTSTRKQAPRVLVHTTSATGRHQQLHTTSATGRRPTAPSHKYLGAFQVAREHGAEPVVGQSPALLLRVPAHSRQPSGRESLPCG